MTIDGNFEINAFGKGEFFRGPDDPPTTEEGKKKITSQDIRDAIKKLNKNAEVLDSIQQQRKEQGKINQNLEDSMVRQKQEALDRLQIEEQVRMEELEQKLLKEKEELQRKLNNDAKNEAPRFSLDSD